jgi:hypothetical protein
MALSDPYATVAQYRAMIGKADVGADAEILSDLTAISRYLEGRLGRFFNVDTVAVARTYALPNTTSVLTIDDLAAAPTSIKIASATGSFASATAFASTDYELLPLNALLQPEPWPYTAINLPSWSTQGGSFARDARVQVTGRFGWPAVPAAIRSATIQLCGILRMESPRATMRIDELGDQTVASRDAQRIIDKLLDQYRRGAAVFA